MATIRVLHAPNSQQPNNFRAIVHVPVAIGNNSVGVPWKTCYLASFEGEQPKSLLTVVGNGPGQITQQELNSIQAGDLIEVEFTFSDDPSLNTPNRQALIALLANRAIAQFQDEFAVRYKYYGYTQVM